MDAILGFAVFSGPLWLILILLPVSIWIAIKIAKRFKQRSAKLASGIGVVLLFFLVLFGGEIAGRIYLNHLCTTEAGVRVYQAVKLPAEYWDEQGTAKFINPRGVLVGEMLGDRFVWHNVGEPYINWFVKIDRERWLLQDNQSKQSLGEKITFVRHSLRARESEALARSPR